MTDDELLEQIGAAAQRAEDERMAGEPIDTATRERFVQAIIGSYPQAAARQQRLRFARRSSIAAGVLALAAGAILFVRTPSVSDLPVYEMAVVGGAREYRGEAPAAAAAATSPPPRLRSGDRVELVLRPQRAVEGTLATRAVFTRGAEVVPWSATIEQAPQGTLRLVIERDALPTLAPGAWDLVVAMGRPGTLPDDPSALVRGGARWQTHRTTLVIE